ncbi:MAG: TrkH family potassium uptake protein [Steroidobacteraceae bacterium]|nr:TrkH family potassium uptake protein [Steroidobacteraceae bacterium]
MNLPMVQRILGLMLLLFSLTMLPPIGVSFLHADDHWYPFAAAFAVVASIGALLYLPVRKVQRDLRLRDGFLVVAMFWICLGLAGATPLLITDVPRLSFTDAVFEAVSGFTTTGATVIVGLDTLPTSILYYRQQIQWLGGMGIIVLAVALLPVLGVGGMSLYKAETPGPVKDQKLTPRIAHTAKALWLVYLVLTAACALAYWLAGMDAFDAISHAFSTLSTGGFSPYDASLARFDSYAIDMIAIFFMLAGGTSFALHFLMFRQRSVVAYWREPEFRAYVLIVAAFVTVVTCYLWIAGTYGSLAEAFRYGAFQVVSIQTSTGFLTTDFSVWPGALPALIMLTTFIGGCAGSTAGGIKVIRWLLVFKQGTVELRRLVHPSAEIPVKIADKTVPVSVMNAVAGFFAIYLVLFGGMMLLLMTFGLDQVTAWSAVATCINNAGPGLGAVAANFREVPDAAKWVCTLAMLIGRLELFTLIVLFTPDFWRR